MKPGKDPLRRPGDRKRDPDPERPHDPRRVPEGPPRDDRKPAGDESIDRANDDVPDPRDKPRAPIPRLMKVKRPEPVD